MYLTTRNIRAKLIVPIFASTRGVHGPVINNELEYKKHSSQGPLKRSQGYVGWERV